MRGEVAELERVGEVDNPRQSGMYVWEEVINGEGSLRGLDDARRRGRVQPVVSFMNRDSCFGCLEVIEELSEKYS